MTTYKPDKWVVLEVTTPDGTYKKILSSWYGGFADGDSWRLSSNIDNVTEEQHYFDFETDTGSVYHCFKDNIGISAYTQSIYNSWLQELPDDIELKILEEF